MLNLSNDQIKKLISIYPYLIPKNVITGKVIEDYNYDHYVGQHDLPDGWARLYLMFCKAIKPYLVNANILYSFMFTQVKEKYGTMRLYNNGYTADMLPIIMLYEGFSEYVCEDCGDFATKQTTHWIGSYCYTCYIHKHTGETRKIKLPRKLTIVTYKNKHKRKKSYSYRSLKKEFIKVMRMTDEEFFNYLITV